MFEGSMAKKVGQLAELSTLSTNQATLTFLGHRQKHSSPNFNSHFVNNEKNEINHKTNIQTKSLDA